MEILKEIFIGWLYILGIVAIVYLVYAIISSFIEVNIDKKKKREVINELDKALEAEMPNIINDLIEMIKEEEKPTKTTKNKKNETTKKN